MRRLFWCSRLRASAGALQLARRCLELGHRAAQSARRMEIHLADIERTFGLLHRVAVASLLILEPQRFGCARQRDDLAFLLLTLAGSESICRLKRTSAPGRLIDLPHACNRDPDTGRNFTGAGPDRS